MTKLRDDSNNGNMAVPKDNSRCAILKARVHVAMHLVKLETQNITNSRFRSSTVDLCVSILSLLAPILNIGPKLVQKGSKIGPKND